MYDSRNYPRPGPEEIERFVQEQRHALVIGHGVSGHPSVSILPFVKAGERITVHMVQADPTFAALQADPRGSVMFEEFLAFTPHWLMGRDDASNATLQFRAVLFEVEATRVSTEPADVAAALEELFGRYEPGEGHVPVTELDPYRHMLVRLGVVDFAVRACLPKFKVAQNKTPAERERLLGYLGERAEWRDAQAARVIAALAPKT